MAAGGGQRSEVSGQKSFSRVSWAVFSIREIRGEKVWSAAAWGAIAKSCNRTVFRIQYSEFRSYIPTRYDSYPGVVHVLLVEDIQAGCDFWRKLLGINSEC